jgi:hypothetical protein|uniref:Uncharacterized protein n=1 Tax=Siphoviridae sp. cttFh17 TaxID=2826491 RepID=A0A8S5NK13_9CAUD|nr:MAG TPA: hypothetical protein [Siphoviridae sp. cttFh17]
MILSKSVSAHDFQIKERINKYKEVQNLQIRIVGFSDRYDDYKLLGYTEVENISEVFKTLDYMRKNEIPLIINTNDIIDTDGEEYYINSITMVFPKVSGEIGSCITVYVEDV